MNDEKVTFGTDCIDAGKLHTKGEYVGYTEPGDQARMESIQEINRLLQLI